MTTQPGLNGQRVKWGDKIYLILDGERRWIPNPTTYDNLFRDWNGVINNNDVITIFEGNWLSDGAILARAPHHPPVYLISNGVKRWIQSPEAMDKYHFNWNKIIEVPKILLDFIQNGPTLN